MTELDRLAISNIKDNLHDYIWFSLTRHFQYRRFFKPVRVNKILQILTRAESYIDTEHKKSLKSDVARAHSSGSPQQLYTIIQEELRRPVLTLAKLIGVLYLVLQISKHHVLEERESEVDSVINYTILQLDLRCIDEELEPDIDQTRLSHIAGLGLILLYGIWRTS